VHGRPGFGDRWTGEARTLPLQSRVGIFCFVRRGWCWISLADEDLCLRVSSYPLFIYFYVYIFWSTDGRAGNGIFRCWILRCETHSRYYRAPCATTSQPPPKPLNPITHHTTIPCILSLQPGFNSSLPAPACLAPLMRPRLLIHPRFARPHPARAPIGSCGRFTMHLSIPKPLHCLPERQTCRVWSTCGSRNGEGGSGREGNRAKGLSVESLRGLRLGVRRGLFHGWNQWRRFGWRGSLVRRCAGERVFFF
jgi:hypothetical protein